MEHVFLISKNRQSLKKIKKKICKRNLKQRVEIKLFNKKKQHGVLGLLVSSLINGAGVTCHSW